MIELFLHLFLASTSPTVGGCGVDPTIVGSNNVFRVNPGKGAIGCVVVFAARQFEHCDVVSSSPAMFVFRKSTTEIEFDFVGNPAPQALEVACLPPLRSKP